MTRTVLALVVGALVVLAVQLAGLRREVGWLRDGVAILDQSATTAEWQAEDARKACEALAHRKGTR